MAVNRGNVVRRIKSYREDYFKKDFVPYMFKYKESEVIEYCKQEGIGRRDRKRGDKLAVMELEQQLIDFQNAAEEIASMDKDATSIRQRKKRLKDIYSKYNVFKNHMILQYMSRIAGEQERTKDAALIAISQKNYEHFQEVEIPDDCMTDMIEKYIDHKGLIIVVDNGPLIVIDVTKQTKKKRTEYILSIYPPLDKDIMWYQCAMHTHGDRKPLNDMISHAASGIIKSCDKGIPEGIRITDMVAGIVSILMYSESQNVVIPEVEYNIARRKYQKKIDHANDDERIERYKKILEEMPGYAFTEIDSARVHYKPKKGNGDGTPKSPHWRQAHFHTYWKGPRDSEQEKVVYYIPYVWVGDPRAKKPKIIKLITKGG